VGFRGLHSDELSQRSRLASSAQAIFKIKFGMIIQQNHERIEVWRGTHPEYFWWEREEYGRLCKAAILLNLRCD
jgi:hypothetical protein